VKREGETGRWGVGNRVACSRKKANPLGRHGNTIGGSKPKEKSYAAKKMGGGK